MRTLVTILLGAVLFFPLSALATEIPGGPVYGHWYSSGNPYNVNGIIDVPVDSTLYIHEGVEVIFQGWYYLHVNGFLQAVGTEADSIHFRCSGSAWAGLSFENAPDSSHLAYCTVQDVDDYGPYCRGAITCYLSNPVITHCRISRNSEQYGGYLSGGGIYLHTSSPEISWCNISQNYTVSYGGGINCMYSSSPVIRGCDIRGNSTLIAWDAQGGGIHVGGGCNPEIINCTIEGNRSYTGGGIASENGRVTLAECTIAKNLADGGVGGGIWITGGASADMFITGSTIDSNVVRYANPGPGGGIYAGCDTLLVDHCTFAHNYPSDQSSLIGWAIHAEGSTSLILANSIVKGRGSLDRLVGLFGASASITYSDFYLYRDAFVGNLPPGLGELTQVNANGDSCDVYFNIFLDPAFVGLYDQDYNLRWRSPCIDAGDPNSPLDPDNTVCDMGRFYLNQAVLGVVEVYPQDEPIVIPPGGGQLVYDGWVFNFTGHPGRADIWTYAFVPGVGRYGPIDLYRNFRIPPDSIGMNNIRQKVPGLAPEGDYTLVAYVGRYPSTIIDSSYFYFSKEGSVAGDIGDWTSSGLRFTAGDEAPFNLPSHYGLSQNYPNPFNAKTVINYQVPVDGHVKLEVYNTLGQRVATLVDSKEQAGYRSIVWDASEVASGLYFYKLTAGEKTITQRMLLLK